MDMGGANGKPRSAIKVAFGCLALLIGIILLSISFKSCDHNEYCLTKSYGKVGSKVYATGRYALGPAKSFIRFDSRSIFMEFSNEMVRTSDENSVQIDYSMQFQLRIEDVHKLYLKYKTRPRWETQIRKNVRDNLRDVMSQFSLREWFEDRLEMSTTIETALRESLEGTFARLNAFQLGKIDMATSVESYYKQIEITKQLAKKEAQTLAKQRVESDTSRIVRNIQADTESQKLAVEVESKNAVAPLEREIAVIQEQTVQNMTMLQQELDQKTATTNANITVIEAETAATINQLEATTDATFNQLKAEAQSLADQRVKQAQADGFKLVEEAKQSGLGAIKTALGWTTSDLIKYKWSQVLSGHASDQLYISLDSTVVLTPT